MIIYSLDHLKMPCNCWRHTWGWFIWLLFASQAYVAVWKLDWTPAVLAALLLPKRVDGPGFSLPLLKQQGRWMFVAHSLGRSFLFSLPVDTFIFFSSFNFCKCLFIFERERECVTGQGAEKEGDTESESGSRLQAVSTETRHRARTRKLPDHDLSRSQTPNRLSHPGTPKVLCFLYST